MPIEVKELVIKTIVTDSKPQTIGRRKDTSTLSTKKIISACVEQVLQILERDKER